MKILFFLLLSYLPTKCLCDGIRCFPEPPHCPQPDNFRSGCSTFAPCFSCKLVMQCYDAGFKRVGCTGTVGDQGSCEPCRKDQHAYVADKHLFGNFVSCKDCESCPPGQERPRCALLKKKSYLLDSGLNSEYVCTKETQCGGNQAGKCTACPHGKFKSDSNNALCQDCGACPQAYLYREGCGGSNPGQCVPCSAIDGCETLSLKCTSARTSSCTKCRAGFYLGSERATTVIISTPESLAGARLVDASGAPIINGTTGILQMSDGENGWRYVCDDYFEDNLNGASVACRELGLFGGTPSYASIFDLDRDYSWYTNVKCAGSENSLTQCAFRLASKLSVCGPTEAVTLTCKPDRPPAAGVRLVNTSGLPIVNATAGLLQMSDGNHGWRHICVSQEEGDLNAANVACRELGLFGGRIHADSGNYPSTDFYVGVKCTGDEKSLAQCEFSVGSPHTLCSWYDTVALSCTTTKPPPPGVRLVNASGSPVIDSTTGILQMSDGKNGWWYVCGQSFEDNLHGTGVACRELGYFFGSSHTHAQIDSNLDFSWWYGDVKCTGSESSLTQCKPKFRAKRFCNGDSHGMQAVMMHCTATKPPPPGVRLVNASGSPVIDSTTGILQMSDGKNGWGYVCHNEFGQNTHGINVACREMGFRFGGTLGAGWISQRSAYVWYNKLVCQGGETSLSQCEFVLQKKRDCSQSDAVMVTCRKEKKPCVDQDTCLRSFSVISSDSTCTSSRAGCHSILRGSATASCCPVTCNTCDYKSPGCRPGDAVTAMWPGGVYYGVYYSATISDLDGDLVLVNWKDGNPEYRVLEAIDVLKLGIPCGKVASRGARLVNASGSPMLNANNGLLQMSDGSNGWRYVCDDFFEKDNKGVDVACRELGFHFGGTQSDGQVLQERYRQQWWYYGVHCTGSEASLAQCAFEMSDCDPQQAVTITCATSSSASSSLITTSSIIASVATTTRSTTTLYAACYPCPKIADCRQVECDAAGSNARCSECVRGYTPSKDGAARCDDINECIVYNITCADNGHCENFRGGFRCSCDEGFEDHSTNDSKVCVNMVTVNDAFHGAEFNFCKALFSGFADCAFTLGRIVLLQILTFTTAATAFQRVCAHVRKVSIFRSRRLGAITLVISFLAASLCTGLIVLVMFLTARSDTFDSVSRAQLMNAAASGLCRMTSPKFARVPQHTLARSFSWVLIWIFAAPVLLGALGVTVWTSVLAGKMRGHQSNPVSRAAVYVVDNRDSESLLAARADSEAGLDDFTPMPMATLARQLAKAELRQVRAPYLVMLVALGAGMALDIASEIIFSRCTEPVSSMPVAWAAKYLVWLLLICCCGLRLRFRQKLFCAPILLTNAVLVADFGWTSYVGWASGACLTIAMALSIWEIPACKNWRGRKHLMAPQLLQLATNISSAENASGTKQSLSDLPRAFRPKLFDLARNLPSGALASLMFYCGSLSGVLNPALQQDPEVDEAISQLAYLETGQQDLPAVLDLLVATALEASTEQTNDTRKNSDRLIVNSTVDRILRRLWKLALQLNADLVVNRLRLDEVADPERPQHALWELMLMNIPDPLLKVLEQRQNKVEGEAVLVSAVKMTLAVAPDLFSARLDTRGYTFMHLVVEHCTAGALEPQIAADVCRLCVLNDPSLPALLNHRKVDVTSMAMSSGVTQLIAILSMSLHSRFQVITPQPQHRSATCEVYYCFDLEREFMGTDGMPMPLVIKVMRDEAQWWCELRSRREHGLQGEDVLPILWPAEGNETNAMATTTATSESADQVISESQSRAATIQGRFPYSLVLPRAVRTLHTTISESRIAGVDPHAVAIIVRDVAMCLFNIHCAGVIHGDVKPRNIVQMPGGAWSLIDMDASVMIGAPLTSKSSTGYGAPETVEGPTESHTSEGLAAMPASENERDAGMPAAGAPTNSIEEDNRALRAENTRLRAQIRRLQQAEATTITEPELDSESKSDAGHAPPRRPLVAPRIVSGMVINASPVIDVWSFAVTMFELMAGQSLLDKNVYDQATATGMTKLQGWTTLSEADRRLIFQFHSGSEDAVVISQAVDLVTRCLVRDPAQRLEMRDILAHPFLAVGNVKKSSLQKVCGWQCHFSLLRLVCANRSV